MDKIWAVGYPRSGNSWVRYICLFLMGLEGIDAHAKDAPSSPYLKTHFLAQTEKVKKQVRKLIVPVRNYKEAIIRHLQEKKLGPIETLKMAIDSNPVSPDSPMNYFHPLIVYDGWKAEKRMMVYYESLLLHPEKIITRLGAFIEAKPEKAKQFIRNLDDHRAKSIVEYRESHTSGSTINHHKFKIPEDKWRVWDQIMRNKYPLLYDKYLSIYKEI